MCPPAHSSSGARVATSDTLAASPFPVDEHELLDRGVISVAQEHLQLVAYLRGQPNLLNPGIEGEFKWLGVSEVKRTRISRGGRAHRGMVPDAATETFLLDHSKGVFPI